MTSKFYKTDEEIEYDKRMEVVHTAAGKKMRNVGRAYAAYFRRRAEDGGGDVTGGEACRRRGRRRADADAIQRRRRQGDAR